MPEFISQAAGDIPIILLRTLLSIVALFLISKLTGARQISQLSFYDYIVGITIGSIAATLALDAQVPLLHPLLALAMYLAFTLLSTFASNKSIILRRMLDGTPLILIDKGKIAEKNLKKSGMDINEFLSECRGQGYFDLTEIEYAVMETTGRVSILPKSANRPVTPEDIALQPAPAQLRANVILDGKVMPRHLRSVGKDEVWLERQLHAHGCQVQDVLLAIADTSNTLEVHLKNNADAQEFFM